MRRRLLLAAQEPRLNEEIRAREVRLIGYDGEQMGIYPISSAQQIADDEGLDLVEIAPNADPPVCRIMDYGKFKYDQAIKAKQARKNQSKIETKEMKFRPKIDVGDYETKKKHVLRFLDSGSKVKITIMFRGREMAHPEQGLSILERLADDLKDVAAIESQPKMEGRNMHMMIAPLAGAGKKKDAKQEAKAQGAKEPAPVGEAAPEEQETTAVGAALKAAQDAAEKAAEAAQDAAGA
ncbi:MAG: translation initiation factor IF-3 [Eggerthellaceae bacterium]|nr:translation initiation factor IF-3 [Eggerthellaceae bacterium]